MLELIFFETFVAQGGEEVEEYGQIGLVRVVLLSVLITFSTTGH